MSAPPGSPTPTFGPTARLIRQTVFGLLALPLSTAAVRAQDLVPGAYAPAPVGFNVVTVSANVSGGRRLRPVVAGRGCARHPRGHVPWIRPGAVHRRALCGLQCRVAGDGNFWPGGLVTVDGTQNLEQQRNSRLGFTLAVPIARQQLRIAYSYGAYTTVGGDFRSVGVWSSQAWAGRP